MLTGYPIVRPISKDHIPYLCIDSAIDEAMMVRLHFKLVAPPQMRYCSLWQDRRWIKC